MRRHETIVAQATAHGLAGVAIIRLSGDESFQIASAVAGRSIAPGVHLVRTPFDTCLVIGFKAPKSYTGEDVVEFQCHGGEVTPRRIEEACVHAGARLARRGEFTERAVLAGKLDARQAESVLDLIHAKTVRAAEAARAGLEGTVREDEKRLYEEALALSADLEHLLDFSEDELPPDFVDALRVRVRAFQRDIEERCCSAHEGKLLRHGALVVLAGPPNAGKSSLLNALVGENRAIVSATPGTTRDTVEEWIDVEGFPIRLVDTAGLRTTADEIEREGVRRAEDLIRSADVVLDLGADLPASENVIKLHAKCDLGPGEGLPVSSKTGEGLGALKRRLVETLRHVRLAPDEDSPRARAQEVFSHAQRALRELATAPFDLVVAANVVRQISEDLGSLVGATYSSDLLTRLFSRFCVGK